MVWNNPFLSIVVEEKFRARKEEKFPSLVPLFFLSRAITLLKQGNHFCTMIVHIMEPCFACFAVVCPIDVPSLNFLEWWLVHARYHVVTRHHTSGKEMLAHPVTGALNFKCIGVLDMSKYMHEHESFRFEPFRDSFKKWLPIAHVLKHFDSDYTIELSSVWCPLKVVHVASNYYEIIKTALLCLRHDIFTLRFRIRDWNNPTRGILFSHP